MADENRWRDEDRMRQQDDRFGGSQSYGQPGQDRGYGQGGYGQQGFERTQGYGQGQSYGHAGGYDRSYGADRGQSGGAGGGSQNYGQQYGAGEPIPYGQGQGQQSYQGFSQSTGRGGLQPAGGYGGERSSSFYGVPGAGQGGQSGGAYTGQTGTGYGRTFGGEQQAQGRHEDQSWWDKAKDRAQSFFSGDDQPGHGAHRGRGPKGYSRSDERIRDDVNDRLTDDPFLDASDIEVTVDKGEVTLSGTVSERQDKRRAEDLADNISGVKHVQNNLRVGRSGDSGGLFSKDRQAGTGQTG